MSKRELKGHYATIPPGQKIKEELTEATKERIKTHFDDDDVDKEDLREFLYRYDNDREAIIDFFDLLGELTKKEKEDKEILKDCIKCLGPFPEYEKKFLINVLSSDATDENRFRFLEETIFSRPPKLLEDFKMAKPELNDKIVESLKGNPINKNDNITGAVETVLNLESTAGPFPHSADLYEMGDIGDNPRSLKTTFDHCQSVPKLRLIILKNLLLEADREGYLPLVLKIVLSHCDVDLRSILDKVELSEDLAPRIAELGFGDNPSSSEVKLKELSTVNQIANANLKKFVQMAAGLEEDE